jgi:hypothetical protein
MREEDLLRQKVFIQQQRIAEHQRVIASLEAQRNVRPDHLREERIALRDMVNDLGAVLGELHDFEIA